MHVAGASPERDSPRAAFALLSRRANVAIVIALLALSALAWHSTIEDAVSMRRMVMGLGQIGWLAQGDMSAGIFLAMWVTMMAAMMLPAIAPMVLAHLAVTRRLGHGIVPTLVFVAGYLAVWSAIGAVPLLVYKAFLRQAQHRLDEAAVLFRRTVSIFLSAGEPLQAAESIVELALVEQGRGEPEKAIQILARANTLIGLAVETGPRASP